MRYLEASKPAFLTIQSLDDVESIRKVLSGSCVGAFWIKGADYITGNIQINLLKFGQR